jgi:thymidylate kinase
VNETTIVEKPLAESASLAEIPARLFAALNQSGVRYCNWKSRIRIPDGLEGRTDLDLLVDPRDITAFQEILSAHEVKQFRAAPGKAYPGIENYLGFDPGTGRLFHLHVHYQLVLGEQYVKNYHLPIEQDFLNNTTLQCNVKIPRPEVELIVFVVRSLLKYRDRDGIKEIARSILKRQKTGTGGFPAGVIREARWLLDLTSLQQVRDQLQQWQDVIPADVVIELLQSLKNKTLTGSQILRLRKLLRNALLSHQRESRERVTLRYFREDWRRKRKIFKPRIQKKMTRPQGGVRIAFIGTDGAGKSTVIQQIQKWLSWRMSVRTYYMGKSRSLLATQFAKRVTSLSRSVFSGCSRLFGKGSLITHLARWNQRFWENISFLAEGWERNQQFQQSMLESEAGCIVLYDRYPLKDVRMFDRPVDGPRIATEWNGRASGLERRLARIEEDLYQQITIPDRIIALRVHPETSRVRKPDHDYETILQKAGAIDQAILTVPGLMVIQADAPIEQVVQQVKSIIWDCL